MKHIQYLAQKNVLLIRFVVLLLCAYITTKLVESRIVGTEMRDVATALIAGFFFSVIEYVLHITVTAPTKELQQDLANAGMDIKVDGLMGPVTEAAIRDAVNSPGIRIPEATHVT